MEKKLFVLSLDAMVWEDVEYLRQRPHFASIMKHCAGVRRVRTIYPSITYPAHVSIVTGCRPGKHGVYTNGAFKTDDGPTAWHYTGDIIQVEDIFSVAHKAGRSTAAVFWPVTGGNPNIDYLIDEYFFPDSNESIEEGFARLGASKTTLEIVQENMARFPETFKHIKGEINKSNTLDDFINGCICSLIQHYQPDVLFAHNCMLDTLRHRYGVFNGYICNGLDLVDEWLGEIVETMRSAGVYENTNFVVLSDHGQMNYSRRLKLNVLLQRGGFIQLSPDGSVLDWQAFSQANGMSATIFLKNKDKSLRDKVYDYLLELCKEGVWGFTTVYTEQEVRKKYGMYGDFSFMVETDGYTAFSDSCNEPILVPIDFSDYRTGNATHGYEPEKGPQPFFLVTGPDFKQDILIPSCEIIDEAPTFAKLLNTSLPEAEGKCLDSIFL